MSTRINKAWISEFSLLLTKSSNGRSPIWRWQGFLVKRTMAMLVFISKVPVRWIPFAGFAEEFGIFHLSFIGYWFVGEAINKVWWTSSGGGWICDFSLSLTKSSNGRSPIWRWRGLLIKQTCSLPAVSSYDGFLLLNMLQNLKLFVKTIDTLKTNIWNNAERVTRNFKKNLRFYV